MSSDNSTSQHTTFETGVKSSEFGFTWKIKNFHEIFENRALIESQMIELSPDNIAGLPFTCIVFMRCSGLVSDQWMGIHCQVTDRPSDSNSSLCAKFSVSFMDDKGEIVWEETSRITDMYMSYSTLGFPKMIKADSDLSFLIDNSLVMNISFRIYENVQQTQYVTEKKRQRDDENDNIESGSVESEVKKLKIEA